MTLRLATPPRATADDDPAILPLVPGSGIALARGRVHEICGPARRSMAAFVMGRTEGPVLWLMPGWQAERPNPPGLAALADPGRMILALPRRPEDILWGMEEALRSGVVPLVIAEVPTPPGLTPMRRLQLATQAGVGQAGGGQALGLVLTPADGGAAGAETRWHIRQTPGGTWRLDLRRGRGVLPAAWTLSRGSQGLAADRLPD
jgi:protein ImuA